MADSIVVYLHLNGARQPVSVRPVGLSTAEAVYDWAKSQSGAQGPFTIVGFCDKSTRQNIWVGSLANGLGPGIPQEQLKDGGEYEILIGGDGPGQSVLHRPPFRSAAWGGSSSSYLEPSFMYEPSPVYPLYDSDTCLYAQPDFGPTYSSAAVAPGMSGRIANVYYLDEFGNRISGPGALTEAMEYDSWPFPAVTGYSASPKKRSSRSGTKSPGRRSSRSRSHSTGAPEVWDRLSAPKKTPESEHYRRRQPPQRSDSERQEVIERLLQPRPHYEHDAESYDPNLRTVYRKMRPEEEEEFVYRMYEPYKNSIPRRDVYDERKAFEKRMQNFRVPEERGKPTMYFGKTTGSFEDPLDLKPHPPARLSEEQKKQTHDRLYEQAQAHRAKLQLREQEKIAQDNPKDRSKKLSPSDFKLMQERLANPPPATVPVNYFETLDPKDRKYAGTLKLTPTQRDNMVDRLGKPKELKPEPPSKPGKKLTHDQEEQLLEKLTRPLERVEKEREANPVVIHRDKDQGRGNEQKWSNVWSSGPSKSVQQQLGWTDLDKVKW